MASLSAMPVSVMGGGTAPPGPYQILAQIRKKKMLFPAIFAYFEKLNEISKEKRKDTMNTQEPFVITISREVGSGGHTVGGILARQLNARYCDKLLLESLEKQFNLSASAIEKLKGEKKNWLADFISFIAPVPSARQLGADPRFTQEFRTDVTTEDIFKAEVEILRGFTDLGSCVIAGRSGFYVFKDHPNKLNVLITASMPYRVERVMKKQELSEESARALIKSIDESRENYIRRFTGASRYDARNYDLVLRADGHTEEELARFILSFCSSS